MSGILAQGARFHLLGMPRNYALTTLENGIKQNACISSNYYEGKNSSCHFDGLFCAYMSAVRLSFAAAFSAMSAAKSVVGIAVLTLFLEPLGRGMVNTLL